MPDHLEIRFSGDLISVSGIKALDCVGGIDDGSDLGRELENRTDCIPIVVPSVHGSRIFFFPR